MQLAGFLFPQYFDNNGNPLNAGKIYAYAADTVTPQDTYSNAAGTALNTNPITLTSSGRTKIFLQNLPYDFVIKNSAGVTIDTISGVGSSAAGGLSSVANYAALRALAAGAYNYVEVGGYSAVGDGGGGLFYWSPSSSLADDSGITIRPASAPATGRWIRLFTGAINVRWFGSGASGTSLASALSYISSSNATLEILDSQAVTANTTVPANVSLVLIKGGFFLISTGVTLTINGPLSAPLQTIFTGLGSVAGNWKVREIYPEWWGAAGDGSTNDVAAVQAAIEFLDDNYTPNDEIPRPDICLTRRYLCNTGLTLRARTSLIGNRSLVPAAFNRAAPRLMFTNLIAASKAITVYNDVKIEGISIKGPGRGVAGYGIYGGLATIAEALGTHTKLKNVVLEDFDTCFVTAGYFNTIDNCDISDCNVGIHFADRANQSVVVDCTIAPGNASPQTGILISGIADGIFIHDCDIESVYYGIVATGGSGINIYGNRFEITNKDFVDIRGNATATDADLTANIRNNFFYDVGANASGSSRSAIMIQAGHVTVDDNVVRKYNAGANTGLTYGVNFGGTGTIYSVLIGANKLDAYQAFANINTFATKEKVRSRFPRTINYEWNLADDPGNNIEHYFQFPLPSGYNAVHSFRQMRTFNLDTLDAVPTEIGVGYTGPATDRVAYLDNFVPSAVTQNLVTYASAQWTAAGLTFLSLVDSRVYLIRMEPGAAVSGRIILTLIVDEFQY